MPPFLSVRHRNHRRYRPGDVARLLLTKAGCGVPQWRGIRAGRRSDAAPRFYRSPDGVGWRPSGGNRGGGRVIASRV